MEGYLSPILINTGLPLLVSIIIPVYNAAKIIEATIMSALRQDHVYKEIIIVDDGSTDDSFRIAKRYESDAVKVVRQENAGAAMARNTGLRLATGNYIQFLDAGDVLSDNKISQQVKALGGDGDKLAVCSYVQFTSDNEIASVSRFPDQSHFIYSSNDPRGFLINLWGGKGESNFIQTNCWLVPASLIRKAGAWRCYKCPDDDGEFFTRVILASEGIVHVPGVYNFYRVQPGSGQLSQRSDYKSLMNTLLTIDLKHRYLSHQVICLK